MPTEPTAAEYLRARLEDYRPDETMVVSVSDVLAVLDELAEVRAAVSSSSPDDTTPPAEDFPLDFDETAALIHRTLESSSCGRCSDGEGYQLCRDLAHVVRDALRPVAGAVPVPADTSRPADDPELVDRAAAWLHSWAGAVSLLNHPWEAVGPARKHRLRAQARGVLMLADGSMETFEGDPGAGSSAVPADAETREG